MKIRILFSTITLLLVSTILTASSPFHVEIKITGLQDSCLYLVSYYGDRYQMVDTACKVDQKVIFQADSLIDEGIYIVTGQKKNKLFEILIDDDQSFKLQSDTADYVLNMVVKGSEANKLFFDYQKFNANKYSELSKLRRSQQYPGIAASKKDSLETLIKNVHKDVAAYKEDFGKEHPAHFLTRVFLMMDEPKIPDSISRSDTSEYYRYFKRNYFQNFDFSDKRVLRTPVFHSKVKNYFEKIVIPVPDTIIAEIDRVMDITEDQDILNFLGWYFLFTYERSDIMGFDKVFVYVGENYFLNQKISNVPPSVYQNIDERVGKLKPGLIGQPAPNLILQDTTGQYTSFLNLRNEFIVLFFWDHDCGTCKKETKDLKALLDTTAYDIGIFAIGANSDLNDWKAYLNEADLPWTHVTGTRSITEDYHNLYDIYSTPVIYVLNKERKIIAKRLAAAQIEGFLNKYKLIIEN